MSKTSTQFATAQPNPDIPSIQDIHAEELSQKMDQVHLIDVRRPDEFVGDQGHIPGARLIVLDTLPEHLGTLPQNEVIVFICRSGGRSARATAFASANGLTKVYNLKGGMLRWNALQLPTESQT